MNESFKSLDKVKPKMEVIFYDYSDNPWLDTDKNNEVSKYTKKSNRLIITIVISIIVILFIAGLIFMN